MRSNLKDFHIASENFKIRSRKIRRAAFETLEPRFLLATDLVTNLGDSGAGSLRQTLATAAANDTVQFASTLTGGTINLSSGPLVLTQSVSILGLGAGNLTISSSNLFTDFNIAAGANVSISGITIALGNAGTQGNGGDIFNSGTLGLTNVTVTSGAAELGAGLYNNGGVVTINGSTFSNNLAQQGGAILNAVGAINITGTTFNGNHSISANVGEAGGAICNESATLTVTGCSFTNNIAGTFGGGICNYSGGTAIISNTSFSNNTADFWGGALFNYIGASMTIQNGCMITSNFADGNFGGGLFNDGGTATISGATFTSNSIGGLNGIGGAIAGFLGSTSIDSSSFISNGGPLMLAGGAIYTDDLSVSISNSTFNSNSAQLGGAIFTDSNSTVVMSGTTLENNSASTEGGGAFLAGISYVFNSTVSTNTSNLGGGIFADGTLTFVNTTIAANVGSAALAAGGGIYVNLGDTTLYNTIVASNTLSNHTTASNITGTVDASLAVGQTPSSNNLIGTGGGGGLHNGTNGNKVGATANLGPLQNNGGPTDTMALLSGSVAINGGSNALARDNLGHALTTDQRGAGFARIVNSTVDIGSYELQSTPAVVSGPAVFGPSPLVPSAHLPLPQIIPSAGTSVPDFDGLTPAVAAAGTPYTPAEVRGAYGVNSIFFNGTPGTGAGQTIAIVDAFNDPNIITDANTFSADFGLPQFNGIGQPTLKVLNQTGGIALPSNATPGGWDIEESLDVEWAHAMAPNANIILFEANSTANTDLYTAVATAASTPGVSVVSMSFSSIQLLDFVGGVSEPGNDPTFTTPAGHQGVTFLGSTGDQGSPATGYAAISPNVVGVGGTSLLIGTDNSYLGESAWAGGGGGLSIQEAQPGYQSSVSASINPNVRLSPDVSAIADPTTGVFVLDTFDGGGFSVGGTSLATPLWAGLIAMVNQGRALRGQSSLDGVSQTLPMLYGLPSIDFHDITTGDNGFPATPGYDLATGLGTPIANLLVPTLAGFPGTAVWTGLQSNDWFNPNNWNTFSVPNASTNVIINFGNPTANTPFTIAGLTINGGDLQFGINAGGFNVTGLSITGSGTIDMTNDFMFINFGSAADPISQIRGYLKSGYNGGAWTGTGIDSSSAAVNLLYGLGYADGIDGVVTGLSAGQIEIEYTLYGDANLDRSVNGSDFAILATTFNQGVTSWDQADFNYDNAANGTDFAMLATNFNQAASGAAVSTPAVSLANNISTIAVSNTPGISNNSAILNLVPHKVTKKPPAQVLLASNPPKTKPVPPHPSKHK